MQKKTQDPWAALHEAARAAGMTEPEPASEQIKVAWQRVMTKAKELNGFEDDSEVYSEIVSEVLRSWFFWRAARRGDLTMTIYWAVAELGAHLQRGRRQASVRHKQRYLS